MQEIMVAGIGQQGEYLRVETEGRPIEKPRVLVGMIVVADDSPRPGVRETRYLRDLLLDIEV